MSKLNLIAAVSALLIILGLGITTKVQSNQIDKLKVEVVTTHNNYEALESENDSLKSYNLSYQLTVDQLSNTRDSLVTEMNNVRKKLKVKDKELKEMAYVASEVIKTDTIYFKEEILKVPEPIDTLIQDEWSKLHVKLDTNSIIVSPEFKSEKYITTYLRKEIVNPSKCKLMNIFKKRENRLEVDIYEKNPYIINTKEKFIEIIK